MASTYVNDLRLNEMATGDGSGTWGTTTNTNLELIAEAFSYGTEVITTNADTHTTTIADGATDPGRSLYLKYTGTLDSACTITIGPNTVSKVWIIENGTSGSQNIIISQGSGANITIPAGDTKVVYSDGAGAGAAFVDAFASLSVVDLKVQDDLTVTDAALVTGVLTTTATQVATGGITSGSDIISDTDSTDSLGSTGVRWLKGWFDTLTAGTLTVGSGSVTDSSGAISFGDENLTTTGIVTAAGTSVFTNLDISGDIDVDGTTNLDVVDVDGAVNFAADVTFADGADIITASAGTSNFRAGVNAGNSIESGGNYNTVVGDEAGTAITTGDYNTLGANTTGTSNVALGHESLASNTTASFNTALGKSALENNTTGANNTAVGYTALLANTEGTNLTAVGWSALASATTTGYSVAVGSYALRDTTTGRNVGIGSFAGYQTNTGTENTFIGDSTAADNTTGSNNVALGYSALNKNTTASNNVALGSGALYTNTTGANAVAVGYNAGYSQTASTTVAVGASAAYDLTTSDDSVFVGSLCGENVTTGYTNTCMGDRALQSATTGYANTCIGYKAGDNITTGSGNIVIGSADTSSSTSSNECTIPVTTFRLQTSSITNYSDARDKSNVQDSPYGLEFLEKVKLRKWLWDCREEFKKDNQLDGKERIGFVAQELLEAMDEGDNEILDLVYESNPDRLEVRYGNLLPIALKAIQELSAKVKELEDKLDD
jgi:trimeric autotransporter adhesin